MQLGACQRNLKNSAKMWWWWWCQNTCYPNGNWMWILTVDLNAHKGLNFFYLHFFLLPDKFLAGINDLGNKLVSYPECPDLRSFCQKPMILEWLISVQNVLIWEVSQGFDYRYIQLCSKPECPELEKKRRRRRSSAWFHKETR